MDNITEVQISSASMCDLEEYNIGDNMKFSEEPRRLISTDLTRDDILRNVFAMSQATLDEVTIPFRDPTVKIVRFTLAP